MHKKQQGGTFPPRGQLSLRTRRNLGDLTYKAPPGIIGALAGAVRARLSDDPRPGNQLAAWRLSNLLTRFRSGERLPVDARLYLGRLLGMGALTSELRLRHFRPRPLAPERLSKLQRLLSEGIPLDNLIPEFGGQVWDYGVASRRVITTTGVEYLVDTWQGSVELEDMKYHGIGSGSTGPVVGNTALETEFTTEYNPDNTRATGSLGEGATGEIFRTIGTNTMDASAATTEHGLLSQAAVGGGVLWDRHTFTVINLASADSLESTYDMTATSGG